MSTERYEALLQQDMALLARVRARLLAEVAASQQASHRTVRREEGEWTAAGPGVQRKVLHDVDGMSSELFRLAPGARMPPHPHGRDEECVVLEGSVQFGELVLQAGDYHLGRAGHSHGAAVTDTGALLFVRMHRPS